MSKKTHFTILILLIVFAFLFYCSSVNRDQLVVNNFSTWRGSTGEWLIAGDAVLETHNENLLAPVAGNGVIINGPTGNTANLLSKKEFGDVKLHVEFKISKNSNSGVYLMGRYEIQIYDSFGKEQVGYIDCGGIYERWDENRDPKGYEGHPPKVNVSRPAGEWQSIEAIFQAPRFNEDGVKIKNAIFEKVVLNGIVIQENVFVTGPTRSAAFSDEKALGPLMLQGDHGPVAYRNIWLEGIN
jgi:hypothetical protein